MVGTFGSAGHGRRWRNAWSTVRRVRISSPNWRRVPPGPIVSTAMPSTAVQPGSSAASAAKVSLPLLPASPAKPRPTSWKQSTSASPSSRQTRMIRAGSTRPSAPRAHWMFQVMSCIATLRYGAPASADARPRERLDEFPLEPQERDEERGRGSRPGASLRAQGRSTPPVAPGAVAWPPARGGPEGGGGERTEAQHLVLQLLPDPRALGARSAGRNRDRLAGAGDDPRERERDPRAVPGTQADRAAHRADDRDDRAAGQLRGDERAELGDV